MDKKLHFDQTVFSKKERTGFSGGFKIPEEHKIRKENQRRLLGSTQETEKEDTNQEQSLITRDEIMAHLNLGSIEGSIEGKSG